MKVAALGHAKNSLSAYVDHAQHERVLVTRHGKPAALIIGVEGEDFEDSMTRSDPEFWQMIEARRKTLKTILGGHDPETPRAPEVETEAVSVVTLKDASWEPTTTAHRPAGVLPALHLPVPTPPLQGSVTPLRVDPGQ